jgi:hypothetical protein
LNRHYSSSRETLAVTNSVNLIQDRHTRVSGAQKICVQRVNHAARLVDCSGCSYEGLPSHLAAKDSLAIFVRRLTTENVDLNGFEVEQSNQVLKGFTHPFIMPAIGRVCVPD